MINLTNLACRTTSSTTCDAITRIIYVAETLQSRRYLATQLLFSSLVSQGLLVLLTLVLTAWLLRRVLRPMRQLR